MNYIQEVRRVLSEKIDVDSDLLSLYALLVFTRGAHVTWEDVHDAWSIWKDRTNPEHKSIVPFDELSDEVKKMDQEYANAIKMTAIEVNPRNINF